jgi:HlyD family secretion protein
MATGKKSNKTLYIIIGLVAIGVVGFFMRGGKKESRQKVVIEKAAKRNLVESVDASGKVFPTVEVEITSNVSGTLIELKVAEGDFVKAGDLLARIDPDAMASMVERVEASTNTARAQLQSIKAQKEQLEAQFKNTKIVYERNKDLLAQGVISKAEFDISQASYETALANLKAADENILAAQFSVKSAEATVKEQRKNLSQTTIYAPMDGVVSKLNKKRGEQVVGTAQMAGTPILKIANLNSVEVRIDVNERDILSVSLGDTASISLDAYPNRTFDGIVTQIANTASNANGLTLTSDQVTNFEVRVLMLPASYKDLEAANNGKSPFRAGMSATAEIRTNTLYNILSIPVGAVTVRQDSSDTKTAKKSKVANEKLQEYVFVVQADTVVMLPVSIGAQDDTYVEIKTGIDTTQNIVIEPYDAVSKLLKAGMKIEVVTLEALYNKEK